MRSTPGVEKHFSQKKFELVYQYRDDLCYLHQRKSLFGEKKISNFFPSEKSQKNAKKTQNSKSKIENRFQKIFIDIFIC